MTSDNSNFRVFFRAHELFLVPLCRAHILYLISHLMRTLESCTRTAKSEKKIILKFNFIWIQCYFFVDTEQRNTRTF